MWSLPDVDNVPLTCLPVLGDTPWGSDISVGFTLLGGCAASALKFIDKVSL